MVLQPVSGKVDPDLSIIDVCVFRAAFVGRENLDRLFLGADRVVEPVGVFYRDDAIVTAMRDEERTFDVLGDVLERERLSDLDAFFLCFGTDHPSELEVRLGDLGRCLEVLLANLLLPCSEIPMQRGERNAGGEAMVAGGDA